MSNTFVTSVCKRLRIERDVLAAGVHDDLDRRVRQHLRQRRAVELVGERIDDADALAARSVASGIASCTRHSSVR